MLLSDITTATLGWGQQQIMRAQLKPSSYQLQLLDLYRVLELGLTLQGTCKFKSAIRKKKILTSEQGMLSTFLCFCKSKRVGFCCHYHRKPNWFFCLPSGCLISSAFTSQLFRWGPVAEWNWTLPVTSWHERLSPIPPTEHKKWNLWTAAKQTKGLQRWSGISQPLKEGGHSKWD